MLCDLCSEVCDSDGVPGYLGVFFFINVGSLLGGGRLYVTGVEPTPSATMFKSF